MPAERSTVQRVWGGECRVRIVPKGAGRRKHGKKGIMPDSVVLCRSLPLFIVPLGPLPKRTSSLKGAGALSICRGCLGWGRLSWAKIERKAQIIWG